MQGQFLVHSRALKVEAPGGGIDLSRRPRRPTYPVYTAQVMVVEEDVGWGWGVVGALNELVNKV